MLGFVPQPNQPGSSARLHNEMVRTHEYFAFSRWSKLEDCPAKAKSVPFKKGETG